MLTREQVLGMNTGLEMDALIAEHLFGWRRIEGPRHDYDGPCESNDVLIPPTITSQEKAFKYMPARGATPFAYFVNHRWSNEISAAWDVITNMQSEGYRYCINEISEESGGVERGEAEAGDIHVNFIREGRYFWAYSKSAAESICKAALIAVLDL